MEHEINHALFKTDDPDARQKCIIIIRDIEDISTVLGNQDFKLATKFIDMIDTDVDFEAQKMLDNLKQKLNREIPRYNFLKLRVNFLIILFSFLEFIFVSLFSFINK